MSASDAPAVVAPRASLTSLVAICAATSLPLFAASAPFALLGELGADLGADLGRQGWVLTAYAAALAGFLIPAGVLGDRAGHRRILGWGLMAFAAASTACASAAGPDELVAARAAQGAAAGLILAARPALVARDFPGTERGWALGAWGATVGGAFAAGPLVGGALAGSAGWRASFVLSALGALGALGLSRVLSERVPTRRPAIDAPGTVALLLGVGLLVVAAARAGLAAPAQTLLAVVVALALIAVAVRRGAFVAPRLLHDPGFGAGATALFVLGGATFGPLLCVALFMLQVQGATAVTVGAQLTPLAGTAVLASLPAGRWSATPRSALPAGLLLCAAGGVAMAAAPAAASWTALVPGMVLAGAGTGLINPAAMRCALGAAPEGAVGAAGAAGNVFRQLGLALGLAASGTVVQARVGGTSGDARSAAFAAALDASLLVGAVVAGVAAGMCYALLRADDRLASSASR